MFDTTLSGTRAAGDTQSLATLHVDVVADFVCPWCYLGKRRLDVALNAVHGPTNVRWFPFQLNPSMPSEGMPLGDYLSSRFGSRELVEAGLSRLREAGELEGIRFAFDRIERVPNTLNAHVLMYLAESRGLDASRIAESLMSRFFEQGSDISDPDVLVAIGREHGLGESEIRAGLENEIPRQAVLNQEANMRKSGVAGVPAFLVNKRIFVSGAQDTDVLVSVFDRAMFGDDDEQSTSASLH